MPVSDVPSRQIRLVDPMPVLGRAYREAQRTHHEHVGSEHLALAALGGDDGLEAIARAVGTDPAAVRPALEGCCTMTVELERPTITPRTARMLALAPQMALVDGSGTIASRHLVMVLLGHPSVMAWRGLLAAGLDPQLVSVGLARVTGSAPEPRELVTN